MNALDRKAAEVIARAREERDPRIAWDVTPATTTVVPTPPARTKGARGRRPTPSEPDAQRVA